MFQWKARFIVLCTTLALVAASAGVLSINGFGLIGFRWG
jgi:hypothetical protein